MSEPRDGRDPRERRGRSRGGRRDGLAPCRAVAYRLRPPPPWRRRSAGALCALLALAPAACEPAGAGSAGGTAGAPADAGYVFDPLPDDAPPRFGFGSEAPEALIAARDIDVKPDGEGLPPGSGTVGEGRRVYMTHCMACHGPTGTEGPNDRLVSDAPWEQWPRERAVGNYWPYATTLFDYIRRAMPQLTPGVLTADETYAVIAYVLHLNGIVPEDAVMNAETLPAVRMPARDRFVVDDRRGGAEVR